MGDAQDSCIVGDLCSASAYDNEGGGRIEMWGLGSVTEPGQHEAEAGPRLGAGDYFREGVMTHSSLGLGCSKEGVDGGVQGQMNSSNHSVLLRSV